MFQFAIAIFLLFGTPQDQPEITATADQFERIGDVARWTGNVIATYLDFRIEADTVEFDRSTNILTARQRIRYKRGEENLEADHLTFNVETKAGDFKNVKGEVGPGFFITAEEAHRTPEGEYILKKVNVSTCCDESRPGWMLSLGRATVDPHKRVTAKGSLLRVENVPVFYLPYITVPSSDRPRSTGFLLPSTSNSTTKGRSLRESFYWAINRSADATFTGEYFSKRGPAGAIDFRAIPNQNSGIQVQSLFARDRLGQGGQSARILAFGDVGRGFRSVADMNFVSSFLFRQVYEDGLNIISSPLEHSLAFISRNQPRLSTNFLFARNGVFFVDQPTVVLRKFPSLELGFPSTQIGDLPLYVSGETSVTGFARRDAAITTPAFGQRFDLHPVVEMPVVRSSVLEWSHRFGFRETAYTHSRQAQLVLGESLNRLS